MNAMISKLFTEISQEIFIFIILVCTQFVTLLFVMTVCGVQYYFMEFHLPWFVNACSDICWSA